LPGGGAMLFLIGEDRECCVKQKWTWRYLHDTAASSKRVTLTHPPTSHFS